MAGLLELLCGPSGVGKTSSLEGITRHYRWTTRDPRENDVDPYKSELVELDGKSIYTLDKAIARREKDGVFISTSGYFATRERFLEEHRKVHFAGFHKFPETDDGNLYGFPVQEMLITLKKGKDLAEQVGTYKDIKGIVESFEAEGIKVIKSLFLASIHEIRMRLHHRAKHNNTSQQEYRRRIESVINVLLEYYRNLNSFDNIRYNFPKKLCGEQATREIDRMIKMLDENKGFVVEYDTANPWNVILRSRYGRYLDDLMIFNWIENRIIDESTINILDEEFEFNLPLQKYQKDALVCIKIGTKRELLEHKHRINNILDNLSHIKGAFINLLHYTKSMLTPMYSLKQTFGYSSKIVVDAHDMIIDDWLDRGYTQTPFLIGMGTASRDLFGYEAFDHVLDHVREYFLSIIENRSYQGEKYVFLMLNKEVHEKFEKMQLFSNQLQEDKRISLPKEVINSWLSTDFKIYLTALGGILDLDLKKNEMVSSEFHFLRTYYPSYELHKLMLLYRDFSEHTNIPEEYKLKIDHMNIQGDICKNFDNLFEYVRDKYAIRDIQKEIDKKTEFTRKTGIITVMMQADLDKKNILERKYNSYLKKHYEQSLRLIIPLYFSLIPRIDKYLTVLLHYYSKFREETWAKDIIEDYTLDYIEEHNNIMKLSLDFMKEYFVPDHYKWIFNINYHFLRDLRRLMQSDPSQPLSPDNMWSYPMVLDLRSFLKEYLYFEHPHPNETFKSMRNEIQAIRNLCKQRGKE